MKNNNLELLKKTKILIKENTNKSMLIDFSELERLLNAQEIETRQKCAEIVKDNHVCQSQLCVGCEIIDLIINF